jgi:ABC-type hemin transport system substrate-binding protein
MALKLALVWSETTGVLKEGSCWAVTHQIKNVADLAGVARRRAAYETAMKGTLESVAAWLQKLRRPHFFFFLNALSARW